MDPANLRFGHLRRTLKRLRFGEEILPKQPMAIPSVLSQGNCSFNIFGVSNFSFAPNDLREDMTREKHREFSRLRFVVFLEEIDTLLASAQQIAVVSESHGNGIVVQDR